MNLIYLKVNFKSIIVKFYLFIFGGFALLQAQSKRIDGIVDRTEWADASYFTIGYEIEPANNTPAPYKTEVFVTATDTDILVGFIAEADMSNLRSSVRNRDEIDRDEHVAVGIDTYGDGRSMIIVGQILREASLMLSYFPTEVRMIIMSNLIHLLLSTKTVTM